MTSGIDWNANYSDPKNSTFEMEYSDDWIDFIIHSGMKDIPGKVFDYKDCDTVLLGYIFEKIIGIDLEKYANEYLFGPLKIKAFWNKMPNGKPDPEGGLYLSSKSLLKIGKLILNGGKYQNERLISKEYFKLMIQNQVPSVNELFNYGYQWWLYQDVIFGWGYKGQYLVIDPKNNKVGILFQWHNTKEIEPVDFINKLIKDN